MSARGPKTNKSAGQIWPAAPELDHPAVHHYTMRMLPYLGYTIIMCVAIPRVLVLIRFHSFRVTWVRKMRPTYGRDYT